MPLNVYCTGHRWSRLVCGAFAQGARAPIVAPAPLLKGDMFTYGCLRGLLPTIKQAQREKRALYYADNAYMRPGKDEGAYFRITKNALQHTGLGELAAPKQARARWEQLGMPLKPWRASGGHVLVCPPLRLWGAIWGFCADEWLDNTLKELRRHTDRELRVRAKLSWNDNKSANTVGYAGRAKTSLVKTLAEDLEGCWALVAHSSNAAVEALIAGVPVFCTNPCAAYALGSPDLSQIEHPRLDGDREHWAMVLAANQWQLSEMRDGTAWRALSESPAAL